MSLLADKLRAALLQLRFAPRAWRLVRAAAGRWPLLWAALLLVHGMVPVAVVYLTKPLVDAVAAALGSGDAWSFTAAPVVLAAAMAGVVLAGEVLRAAADWVRALQAKLVEDHVGALIQEKSTQVDLAFYDQPDFHDHLHRARYEARHRPVALLECAGTLAQINIRLVISRKRIVCFMVCRRVQGR